MRVVYPHPEGPTMASESERAIEQSTSHRTVFSALPLEKTLVTPRAINSSEEKDLTKRSMEKHGKEIA